MLHEYLEEKLTALPNLLKDESYLEAATRYWAGVVIINRYDGNEDREMYGDGFSGVADSFIGTFREELAGAQLAYEDASGVDLYDDPEYDPEEEREQVVEAYGPLADLIEERVRVFGQALLDEGWKALGGDE